MAPRAYACPRISLDKAVEMVKIGPERDVPLDLSAAVMLPIELSQNEHMAAYLR